MFDWLYIGTINSTGTSKQYKCCCLWQYLRFYKWSNYFTFCTRIAIQDFTSNDPKWPLEYNGLFWQAIQLQENCILIFLVCNFSDMVRLQACFTLLELMLCRNQQLFLRSFYLRFGRLLLGQFYNYTVTKATEKPKRTFRWTRRFAKNWKSYVYYLIQGNNETEWILIAINIFIINVLGVDSRVLWSIISPWN